MRKIIASMLVMLCGFVCTAQAQLPKVTLRDIDGKTVSTDTASQQRQTVYHRLLCHMVQALQPRARRHQRSL